MEGIKVKLNLINALTKSNLLIYKYGFLYFANKPRCNIHVGKQGTSNTKFPIMIDSLASQSLNMGNHVYIGKNLMLIMVSFHNSGLLSVKSPALSKIESDQKGEIRIGSDVWIGDNVTLICTGINIGNGVVIGANSLIPSGKKLDDYGIYAGVPVRLIRYRFSKEVIRKLLELKWWDIPKERLPQEIFNDTDINSVIRKLESIRA